jgi:hypothetical protein
MLDDLAELRVLYPSLSPDELVVAKENLERYLLLAWEIWEERESAVVLENMAPVDRRDCPSRP